MIKDKKFIYIASPFSHEDEEIRNKRVENVEKFVAYLQCEYVYKGYIIFSPIVHSGHISKYMIDKKYHTFEFWIDEIDEYYLEITDELWVFQDTGWDISHGIIHEIKFAEKKGIPIVLWRKNGDIYTYNRID